MHKRTLGQGLDVSAIGYGCMGISMAYGLHGYARGHHPAAPDEIASVEADLAGHKM